MLYILDEPSIGLHQRDNERLIATLERLRDLGNTVLVVEHDEGTMRAADHLVDMGPGAGEHGGHVVAAGHGRRGHAGPGVADRPVPVAARARSRCRRSAASRPATSRSRARRSTTSRTSTSKVPLGVFCCVTGVSGSGKSTLVNEILYKAVANRLHRARLRPGAHKRMRGLEQLDKIINVDQSPIGRTPRSNPATYIGLFDQIRDLFSKTQEARARGYKPGRFSFNVKGGRCEVCRGDGQIKIEMHFLPDVYVPCEQCHGKRYNRETLDIRFKGKTIADVLDMPIEEALELLRAHPEDQAARCRRCTTWGSTTCGSGQPATTLSGGEAQRVKLASELCKVATGRTLYILDEPTTGLHFADIQRLLEVLQRLVDAGQLGRGDRAQPRRDQDRRPDHRHGPRGRRGGRPTDGRRHARGGRGGRGLLHRPVPGRHRRAPAPARRAPRRAEGAGGRVNVDWLLTTQGRLARIAGGALLILLGLGVIGGFIGVLCLILGAVPIASAAYGALLIGPLFGRDTMGRRPEDQPEEEKKERPRMRRRRTPPTTIPPPRRPNRTGAHRHSPARSGPRARSPGPATSAPEE